LHSFNERVLSTFGSSSSFFTTKKEPSFKNDHLNDRKEVEEEEIALIERERDLEFIYSLHFYIKMHFENTIVSLCHSPCSLFNNKKRRAQSDETSTKTTTKKNANYTQV
jgi:hypothetical protein